MFLTYQQFFYQIPPRQGTMTLLLGYFSKNIVLKNCAWHFSHVTGYISKICHALLSMSRVKSGDFCHGQCHALLWGRKVSRVTFRVTGVFSQICHGLVKKCHGEKKTLCGGRGICLVRLSSERHSRNSFQVSVSVSVLNKFNVLCS